jgi:7-cyano-7-deazaguanine synthase in queuosine biosynthesis
MPKPKINVLCDLVRRKDYMNSFEIDKDALQLSTDEEHGNVFLRLGEIEQWLGKPLTDISRDLAEVAAYIYQADKGIRRGEGDRWTRSFSMLIPVRRLESWNKLNPQLSRTMFELTGEQFDFHFVARHGTGESPGKETQSGAEKKSASDCVCLFSGGADGFAGVVELESMKRWPALVSHYVSNLKPIQQKQVQSFNTAFDRDFEHLQFRVSPQNIKQKTKHPFTVVENTQRSRSFLYLAIAAIVAFERKMDELFICENGVLAINIPLTPARLGSRSTRSAHPHFLKQFQEFISQLFGAQITIRNPFLFKTKKEIIEVVVQKELKKQLRHTVSCWGFPRRTMDTPNTNHCGYCLPCIHRRVAFIAAGYEQWDDEYKIDIFREYNQVSAEVATDFRDLLSFAAKISSMNLDELIYSNPALLVEVGQLCDTGNEVGSIKLAEMLRRYSAEVLGVANKRASGALKQWQILA